MEHPNAPHPLAAELRAGLAEAADPVKAAPMQAYMKTSQPFYGVPTPERRRRFLEAARRYPDLAREEYSRTILELWGGARREEMYQALEIAEHWKAYRDGRSWPLYETLVATATNWDTLDWIAGKLAGRVLAADRSFETRVIQWTDSDHLWTRRASLLVHLSHGADTNTVLLGGTILRLSGEKEFFIRKAIGWVLRQYARTNPDWVKAFVTEHEARLSGLSRREALKRLG